MSRYIARLVFWFLTGLCIGMSCTQLLFGADLDLFKVESVSTDAYKYSYRRIPYLQQYDGQWEAGGQLNLGLRAVDIIKIDANVFADSAYNQVRYVGLHYKVSMDKWRIRPFREHESDHATDTQGLKSYNSQNDYPVYDRYGLSIQWLGK